MYSYSLEKKQDETTKVVLANLHVTYTERIKKAMDTF